MFEKYALDTRVVDFSSVQLKSTAFNVMYKRFAAFGATPFCNMDNKPVW
jgi:hypothetical protein